MIYHDCDQLSEDIRQSEFEMLERYQIIVSLRLDVVEQMVEYLAKLYPHIEHPDEFQELLEHTLEHQEEDELFLNSMQRKGYKKCLGKIFGRRSADAQAKKHRHLQSIGFDGPF